MSITEKRLQAGEDEWVRQIAALTIQLAWRKFYRFHDHSLFTFQNRKINKLFGVNFCSSQAKTAAIVDAKKQTNPSHVGPRRYC